ncbi:MAG: HD domain-containing protein [Oscillospiraceae bacterium]
MNERLKKQIEFLVEIDKMKNIYRQTLVLHEDRAENDAEHSWHLAMLVMILSEYSNQPIDVLHVIKIVLIHDIVEIDAGDTYCYDVEGNKSKAEREEKASQRLFGMLPDDQRQELYSLWREFEEKSTAESKFANVVDRIQPITLNYRKDGISWIKHGVKAQQVLDRNSHVAEGSKELWEYVQYIIDDAVKNGML